MENYERKATIKLCELVMEQLDDLKELIGLHKSVMELTETIDRASETNSEKSEA